VCDWNEDGQRDILVGDRNGYTMLYIEEARGLTLLDTVRANGTKIDVGNNSNPDIVDWDEDGNKDLILGSESGTGTVRLYINQGTNSNPVFTTFSYIYCGGNPIYHYRANPRVWDLDGDGKKDLIIGDQYAYIYFYKNVGTNANPVFNVRDTLELLDGSYIHEYAGVRPFCVDYNGDGAVDILTSDYYGYIRYYENTTNPGVEETEQTVVSNFAVTPNVTRNIVHIRYSLVDIAPVRVEVYSSDGRLVDIIADQSENIGNHELTWNRGHLAAGIYFIKLRVDATITTRKIIML
jgi:hypothetical protein